MRLAAAIFTGTLMCAAPIHAAQALDDAIRLAARHTDCLSGVRLGQAAALPAPAQAASARVEEYLQFHADAVQSSEHGALLPWPARP